MIFNYHIIFCFYFEFFNNNNYKENCILYKTYRHDDMKWIIMNLYYYIQFSCNVTIEFLIKKIILIIKIKKNTNILKKTQIKMQYICNMISR